MATQNRAPTGDGTVTGTVSGSVGSRWTLVDDYPSTSSADALTFGTTAATILFTYSAFTVPAGSTGISVQVRYADGEAANGANNCGSRIVVNGATQNSATHNPSGTAGTLREDNWATNPVTAAAWTVDQVNGVGSNALSGFGVNSTDSNPTFFVASIELQVTYTAPISGTAALTLAALTSAATGTVDVLGTSALVLAALTVASTGTVAGAGISGSAALTLAALTLQAAGTVDVRGTSALALAGLTVAATGTVANPPAEILGTAALVLAALSVTGEGSVVTPGGPVAGTMALVLEAFVVQAASGLVGWKGRFYVTGGRHGPTALGPYRKL